MIYGIGPVQNETSYMLQHKLDTSATPVMQHQEVWLQFERHLENPEKSALAHFTIGRECIDLWIKKTQVSVPPPRRGPY